MLRDGGAALNDAIGAHVLAERAGQAPEVDAVMVEKASVLGAEHGLDDVIRQFINRHGLTVENTALADFIAIAVEEGDGIIVLCTPVLLGFLESRQGQDEHQNCAAHAQRKSFVENLDHKTPETAHAKTP